MVLLISFVGLVDIIGYLGSFLIILAYALNSLEKIESSSVKYQMLNLIGGIFVLSNSWFYGAFPSVVISIFWVLVATISIYKVLFSVRFDS